MRSTSTAAESTRGASEELAVLAARLRSAVAEFKDRDAATFGNEAGRDGGTAASEARPVSSRVGRMSLAPA
jgi:hypothetical protein